MVEILVPLGFFGMVFGIVAVVAYHRNRRIERTALIASGKDASIFNEEKRNNRLSALKYGIFLAGLAIGFVMGDLLAVSGAMTEPVAYISMIMLFGGLALLVFYFISRSGKLGDDGRENS